LSALEMAHQLLRGRAMSRNMGSSPEQEHELEPGAGTWDIAPVGIHSAASVL